MFGEFLKSLRNQIKMSQRELAERVGLDFTYISKIENDVMAPPSEEKLLAMEEVLGVDKYELVLYADKIPTDFKNVILADADVQDYLRERVKVW
jgi:transcriptional regulator with XRE-family HTH domain